MSQLFLFLKGDTRKTISDVAQLLKVIPENGHASKPIRNSMFLTVAGASRSRLNSKSVSHDADSHKEDAVALEEESEMMKIPAMELAADLVSYLFHKPKTSGS